MINRINTLTLLNRVNILKEAFPMKFTPTKFLCNPPQSDLNLSISLCRVFIFTIGHHTHH